MNQRSWDLLLSGALIALLLLGGYTSASVAAVAVLLLLPGYLLHLSLFPERRSIAERTGMSFILSVSLLTLTSALPGGAGARLKALLLLTLGLLGLAWYRRRSSPAPWVPALTTSALPLLLLPLLLLGYTWYTTSQGDRSFTEVYVVEPPEEVPAGVPFPLQVGVVNHEGRSMEYTLTITAEGGSRRIELHRERIRLPPLPVEETWRRQWEKNITLSLPEGEWRIHVALQKPEGAQHLYIRIKAT